MSPIVTLNACKRHAAAFGGFNVLALSVSVAHALIEEPRIARHENDPKALDRSAREALNSPCVFCWLGEPVCREIKGSLRF